MDWIEKIKSLTAKTDYSPELKKGEIKKVLLTQLGYDFPDFQFLSYKNSCYSFQRLKNVNGYDVYELFHIFFAYKDCNFACSVASRLIPNYVKSNNYNSSLINPHKDLIVLKRGKGAIPVPEAYYFHNGRIETTQKVVKQIAKDYKNFGLPFLDKQYKRLTENEIVKYGFNFISNLKIDKAQLQAEVESYSEKGAYIISNIKHPIFVQLKEELQEIKGQTKEDKQKIPKTAFELLELYWTIE